MATGMIQASEAACELIGLAPGERLDIDKLLGAEEQAALAAMGA